MVGMDQKPSLQEMIDAVIKTFIVAHAEDGEDDEDGGMEVGHGRMRRQIFDFFVPHCAGEVEDRTTHPHLQRKSPQARRYLFKTV